MSYEELSTGLAAIRVCTGCGALVEADNTDVHDAWHRRADPVVGLPTDDDAPADR